MTNKFKPGARVRTNDVFKTVTKGYGPWSGALVRRDGTIGGAWYVRVDGISKMQVINEKLMEVVK